MQKVVQYIERHKLFSPDDKILVALSGGADSVALLRLLLSLGYTCEAASRSVKSIVNPVTASGRFIIKRVFRRDYLR